MIESISVKPHTHLSEVLFFDEADFSPFENRVIPLFGPNGVGKTTLISALEAHDDLDLVLDGTTTLFFSYQNDRDNFKSRKPRSYMESFDPFFISSRFDAQRISEGQSIVYSVFDLLDGLKPNEEIPQEDGQHIAVLLDEIDSGMSIDNIDTTMRKIKSLARRREDLQFFLSFNSPRVLRHFPHVLSMYDGKPLTLRTDDDMAAEIKAHKREFDKSRKNSRGRPRIYG